jgi:hypothetical protein
MRFQGTPFQCYEIKKINKDGNNNHFKMRVQCILKGMKAKQGGRKILLGSNNTGGWGGHAGADLVPAFWSLDFKCASLYIHIGMTTYKLYADLRKIRLPPNLSERKYCVSRRGSISEYA